MTLVDACKLMEQYAVCPECGCEFIGNGKGTFELLKQFSACNFKGYTMQKLIENAPTVDAVAVVRCKHCQHQKTCKHTRALGINGHCSEGERRSDL